MLIKCNVEGAPTDYTITSYKDLLLLNSVELSCKFHEAKFFGETTRETDPCIKPSHHFVFTHLLSFMKFVTTLIDYGKRDDDDKDGLNPVDQNSTASAEQEF